MSVRGGGLVGMNAGRGGVNAWGHGQSGKSACVAIVDPKLMGWLTNDKPG